MMVVWGKCGRNQQIIDLWWPLVTHCYFTGGVLSYPGNIRVHWSKANHFIYWEFKSSRKIKMSPISMKVLKGVLMNEKWRRDRDYRCTVRDKRKSIPIVSFIRVRYYCHRWWSNHDLTNSIVAIGNGDVCQESMKTIWSTIWDCMYMYWSWIVLKMCQWKGNGNLVLGKVFCSSL